MSRLVRVRQHSTTGSSSATGTSVGGAICLFEDYAVQEDQDIIIVRVI